MPAEAGSCAVPNCPDGAWFQVLPRPDGRGNYFLGMCRRHGDAVNKQGVTYSVDADKRVTLSQEPLAGSGLVVEQLQSVIGPSKHLDGERTVRLKLRGWSLEEAGPTVIDLIIDVEAASDITDALRLLLNPGSD
jgi:hypothetical protein